MTEIAVVAPETGSWADAARHLCTCLRLPQVTWVGVASPIPEDTRAVLAIGPEGWDPDPGGRELWRLRRCATGESARSFAQSSIASELAAGDLPTHRLLKYAPHPGPRSGERSGEAAGRALDALDEALFWSLERLAKGSGALPASEILEWLLLLRVARVEPGRVDALYERIVAPLSERECSDGPFLLRGEESVTSDGRYAEDRTRDAVSALYEALAHRAGGSPSRYGPDRKTLLREPGLIVARTLEKTSPRWRLLSRKKLGRAMSLPDLFVHSVNARRLLAVGIAAHLSGDARVRERVQQTLASERWRHSGTFLPRMVPGGRALCFSPLVALWFQLQFRKHDDCTSIRQGLGRERERAEPIEWPPLRAAASKGSDPSTPFVDVHTRSISRALMDNWLRLHSAPCPEGLKFKLGPANYSPYQYGLERAWTDVFKVMQHRAGRPLVRLRPWPAGSGVALSLRYDVDRPVSEHRIQELVRLQERLLGKYCAAWFLFVDDPNRWRQEEVLRGHGQECGLHLKRASDTIEGMGTTHHSSPSSEYWRGDESISELVELGASYGEFHAGQIVTPRPAWVTRPRKEDGGGASARMGSMWLTPLHFPLEGSTQDRSLAYFDRLYGRFAEMFELGGHLIIGSHPDLNQKLLEEALKREDLRNVWAAPPAEVVDRCRRVSEDVVARRGPQGGVELKGARPLHGLVAEVHRSEGACCDPDTVVINLDPGRWERLF